MPVQNASLWSTCGGSSWSCVSPTRQVCVLTQLGPRSVSVREAHPLRSSVISPLTATLPGCRARQCMPTSSSSQSLSPSCASRSQVELSARQEPDHPLAFVGIATRALHEYWTRRMEAVITEHALCPLQRLDQSRLKQFLWMEETCHGNDMAPASLVSSGVSPLCKAWTFDSSNSNVRRIMMMLLWLLFMMIFESSTIVSRSLNDVSSRIVRCTI